MSSEYQRNSGDSDGDNRKHDEIETPAQLFDSAFIFQSDDAEQWNGNKDDAGEDTSDNK